MAIFNLNTGLITEATSYPLSDLNNLDNILFSLKDNTDKLINPRDLRDSILSIWSSIPFKETYSTVNYPYIGLDTNNPLSPDLKQRIFIGKRSFSGTYSYLPQHDIMTSDLLIGASSSDIFLFNTKTDHIRNTTTKIAILAGKDKNNYSKYSYIQSQYVSGASPSLSLDLVSLSGDINILSNNDYIIFNNIKFPSILENSTSASNNKTLFYENNQLVWDHIKFPNTSIIGTNSEVINLYGSIVNVNNYPIEFTSKYDNMQYYVPIDVGGIKSGSTFNNVSISDVLRRLLYTYIPPMVTIDIDYNYAEIGTFPIPNINFSIFKRTNNTQVAGLINMIPGTYPAINNVDHIKVNGVAKGIISSPPLTSNETNFIISVGDGINIATASTFIKGVYPYFYGYSNNTIFQSTLGTFSKIIDYQSSNQISIEVTQNMIDNNNNFFYYIYDSNYSNLTEVIDDNNNNIIGSFTFSTKTFVSPNGLWVSKTFNVYKWEITTEISPSIFYTFKH